MSSQLLLGWPYGADAHCFWGIRLQASDTFDPTRLKPVLLEFGCHRPAIPKIRRLLETFGQYHCYLQYAWFSNVNVRNTCIALLAEIGVKLEITEERALRMGNIYHKTSAPFGQRYEPQEEIQM